MRDVAQQSSSHAVEKDIRIYLIKFTFASNFHNFANRWLVSCDGSCNRLGGGGRWRAHARKRKVCFLAALSLLFPCMKGVLHAACCMPAAAHTQACCNGRPSTQRKTNHVITSAPSPPGKGSPIARHPSQPSQ
ncbi:hypothetical protein DUNSADRAFT_10251, partial [Dunaliella salina]